MSNDKFIVQDGLTINTIEVFTADGVLIGPSGNTLNASYDHANSAYIHANSAYDQANLAFDTSEASFYTANAAFNAANNKVDKAGDTMTGDLNISTANVTANNLIVNQTLYSGLATRAATPLPNVVAQFTSNSNNYIQVNSQNIDPNGSADYVVTADVGTDSTFYIDVGILGSQYDNAKPDNSLGTSAGPLDGYLYVQGNTGQPSGNLIVGTTSATPGLMTKIIAGGSNVENIVATFDTGGVHVNGTLVVSGDIVSPTINSEHNFTQSAFDKANSANSLAQDAFNKANTGGGGGGALIVSDDVTSNATRYVSFTDTTTGTIDTLYTSSEYLTYNPSNGTLGVNSLNVTANTNISSNVATIHGTSPYVFDSFEVTNYRVAFYQVQLESGGSFHAVNLSVINSVGSAQVTSFGDAFNSGPLGTFNATIVSGMVNVIFTPVTPTTNLTYLRHALVKQTAGIPIGDFGFVADPTTTSFAAGFDLDTTTSSYDYGYLS